MGLLDMLVPGSDGGGLLDFLKRNAALSVADTPTGAPGDTAAYSMPPQAALAPLMAASGAQNGTAPQAASVAPIAPPAIAQPPSASAAPPSILPTIPGASFQPGFMTGYENFRNGGGLIGSIVAGITGQRNDPLGIQQEMAPQIMNLTARALNQRLVAEGMDPKQAASMAVAAVLPGNSAILGKLLAAPSIVPQGATAINPNTGQVVGQGQPRSYAVQPGGELVTPGAPNGNATGNAPAGTPNGTAVYQNTNGLLSDQAATFAAQRLANGGHLDRSEIGYGAVGALNAARIANLLPRLKNPDGSPLTPQQMNLAQAQLHGLQTGEGALGTQEAKVGSAAFEAANAISLARGAINNVSRTNSWGPLNQTFNQLQQLYDEHRLNPAQTQLYVRAQAVINTYATVMSRNGVPSDTARAHAEALLPTDGNPATWNTALDTLMSEINLAKTSPGQMREQLRKEYLGQSGTPNSSGPSPKATAAPFAEGATATNPQTGQRLIYKGGRWQPLQ